MIVSLRLKTWIQGLVSWILDPRSCTDHLLQCHPEYSRNDLI